MKKRNLTKEGTSVTILIDKKGKVIFQNVPEEMLEVAGAISDKDKNTLRKNMWKKPGDKKR